MTGVGIGPEDLTAALLAGYFGKHCECRPLNIERASHSHDCDDDPCEDARVALGGRPNGCGYRSTVEALIHTQAAKRRICDDIIEEGSDHALLAALGKQLLDQAARFKVSQETRGSVRPGSPDLAERSSRTKKRGPQ